MAFWQSSDFWNRLGKAASLLVVALCAMVLAGWLLDIDWLTQIHPDWVSMKANTALALGFAGMALWLRLHAGELRISGRLLAVPPLMLGVLSLIQYLAGIDLGIDQWLVQETHPSHGTLAPGRMAPASALLLVFAGLALSLNERSRAGFRRIQILALLIFLPSLLAGLTYLYGTANDYGLSRYMQLAAPTIAAFLLFSGGLLCLNPEQGLLGLLRGDDSGSAMLRRLLPVALLFPLVIGWLKLGAERAGLFEPDFGVALVAGLYVLVTSALLFWGARFRSQLDVERGAANARIAAREAELNTLLRTVPDLIWMKDAEGRYLFCNALFERLYGSPEAELLGRTDYDFVSREQADFFRAHDRAAQASPHPISNEEWLTFADSGQRILVETTKVAVRDRDGRLLGVLGIARDITQRHESAARAAQAQREAERLLDESNHSRRALLSVLEDNLQTAAQLNASNELLSAFIRHSPIYAFIKRVSDGESRVLMASENYRDLIGIPGSKMVGKTMAELFPPEFAAKMTADDWTVVSRGELLQLDEELNGRSYITLKFPVEIGAERYLAGYTIDITERKQVEEQVRRMNAELEQRVQERTAQLEASNKELEAFSYSVSHDLRAPLRSIAGFVELLKKHNYDAIDDKGRHYMDVIAASAVKMGQLIDDILTFSRIGRTAMQPVRVDLNQLASETVSMLRPQCEGRRVEWKIQPLPEVWGERTLLALVLQNLLANAVKFTRPREVAVIEVGQQPGDEGEVVCFVRDNGVGFDMQYIHKLFGLFQRLHAQDEFDGTGVGLANVQRIIQRHGGRVWAYSEVGAGATFYFSLPRQGGKHESVGTHTAG